MPEPTRRLFFALWPGAGVRRGIVERRDMLGSLSRRRVPDANLHLTLAFLGDRPAGQVVDIEEAAGSLNCRAFRLTLDRFGWFARAGVVWLGGEAPDAARALADSLRAAMQGLGIGIDDRPLVPHVTLFRKVRRRPDFPTPDPLHWPAEDFSLVESIPGRPYQVLRTWAVESRDRT
ncbi:MAG: RNA 2',3'-cyclic phosphodiesterase [Gammaproteobacteria bacterium]|nr:RNA 2',3'-cyclic phosphodiesterase [Gammaproteobacteria bacterium]